MTRAEAVAENTAAFISSLEGRNDSKNKPQYNADWNLYHHYYELQSEEIPDNLGTVTISDDTPFSESAIAEQEENSQNVTFTDGSTGSVVMRDYGTNRVAHVDSTEDISLGAFLARPTLIDTFSWTTSDTVSIKNTIKPWYLFLNNSVILRKLHNFAFLRARLHIKVVINATPFQYGLLRTSYEPLVGNVSTKVKTSPTGTVAATLTTYSQMPGFNVIPANNSGGEMVLPFLYPQNFVNLTSATDIQNLGTLYYAIYAPLRVAVTGGSTSVTVRTYAWMEDVTLMGSTTKLALQGKDEYDEKKGVVSKPAAAVAAAADMLSSIPLIGPFARATSIGATAVSTIAKIFGYTNTPVIADIHGYQPMNAPMLASGHIGTPLQKLALDPKQELSIDPTLHGLSPHDELSFKAFLSREAYVASIAWSTADTVDTQLHNMRINPQLCNTEQLLNGATLKGYRVWDTPMSYLSRIFTHWRGDIIVRIKIVATKFHKGRLKIQYDPIADLSTISAGENETYTQILDIEDGDDVEITIPYHQATAFLKSPRDTNPMWTPGNANAPAYGTDNGILSVRVLNTLVAPASGTVNFLVFVRAGDNFEFANPSDHIGGNSLGNGWTPSFFSLQGQDTVDIETQKIRFGDETQNHPERYALNFGEPVGSLRNLLHRSQVWNTVPVTTSTANQFNLIAKTVNRIPTPNGFNPNAITTASKLLTTGSTNYQFGNMPLITYITSCFAGYRGSVNYSVTPSTDAYGYVDDIRVTRNVDTTSAAGVWYGVRNLAGFTNNDSVKSSFLNWTNNYYDGLAGVAITSSKTNASLTFNFPDYNNFNFAYADPNLYTLGSSLDGTNRQHAEISLLMKYPSAGTDTQSTTTLQIATGAGPDFTCLFFVCCPTTDTQIVAPTPV